MISVILLLAIGLLCLAVVSLGLSIVSLRLAVRLRRLETQLRQLEQRPPTAEQLARRLWDRSSQKIGETPESRDRRAAKYLFYAGWSVDDVAKAFEVDPAVVEAWQNEGSADA